MRTPTEGFDGSGVFVKSKEGHGSVMTDSILPDQESIIVPTRGELVGRRIPLESAHLLLVRAQPRDPMFGDPNVTMDDRSIPGAGREDVIVPVHTPDPTLVAFHGPNPFADEGIPDVNLTRVGTDGEYVTLSDPGE